MLNLFFQAAAAPKAPALPYQKKKYLLSQGERAFYDALREAVGPDFLIFAKVRLADLLYLPKGTESRQGHFNRIQAKHADFVLCDPRTVQPLLAIELDDSSHDRDDRQQRDAFVNEALAAAGLPLLRERAAKSYDPRALRSRLDEGLASAPRE